MKKFEVVQDEAMESAGSSMALAPSETVISKNQMKKLARRQKMLDTRLERRRAEKDKKKQKRKELMKLILEGGAHQHVIDNVKKTKLMSESDNKFRIVIDMDFEDYMTDDEIGKSAKQVGRIYSLNRHSARPCQLYLSKLTGRIRDRFSITNAGYQNWDMNISEKNYLDIFTEKEGCDRGNFIYLTADTDNTLPSVNELLKDESKIFIIGGLVDHNRHKNLCFKRAQELDIKTAKLPIKEHIQLCQRHILSTVAVFEILLNVLASRMSWRDALLVSIPKRKIALPTPTCINETKQTLEVINSEKEEDKFGQS